MVDSMADVVVVGGGHNGLICAAYLAKAGIDTLLIEARDEVGGCASTVSDLGARFNICNCDHTMIRAMPIIDELELPSHGLRYLEPAGGSLSLFHDGSDPWMFFHETEAVLESLAASYPDQVVGYKRYLDDAIPVAKLVIEMAGTYPGVPGMMRRAMRTRSSAISRLINWSRRSVDDVFADYFDDWHVTMPAVSTGPTVWGVPPSVPGTGLAALSYATRHLVKTGRPVGGSGALTDATRAAFEAAGGSVLCSSRVERLVLNEGQVSAVRLTDGSEISTSIVVAACDPQRVLVDWIDQPPPKAKRLIDRWRERPVHEGYESKVDAVLTSLPRYRCTDELGRRHPGIDPLGPTAIISRAPKLWPTPTRGAPLDGWRRTDDSRQRAIGARPVDEVP